MKRFSQKVAILALLSSLSLIAFLIENMFPPLFFPGAKMGLSNIFSLTALVIFSFPEAAIVIVVKTVLGSIFGGNVFSIVYSFTAGIASISVSALLLKLPKIEISLFSISIFSAIVHNMVQLTVYCIISKTEIVFSYMPYLALCGVIAGAIVGLSTTYTIKIIPTQIFENLLLKKNNERH